MKTPLVSGYSRGRTVEIGRKKGALVVGQHGKGKTGAVLVARGVVETPCSLLLDGGYFCDSRDIDCFATHAGRHNLVVGYRPSKAPTYRGPTGWATGY